MKKLLTQNLNRLWACLIIDELKKQGVEHFYCSPGMRNAPFLSALQARDDLAIHSMIDERSAAFCALGQAKYSGRPSVLLCTSGTAAANYYPAVIEAHKTGTPLIVITADRPASVVLVDDNQTIAQNGLFASYCPKTIDLGLPAESVGPKAVTKAVAILAEKAKCGPVHFNQSFDEPLDGSVQKISPAYLRAAEEVFDGALARTKSWYPDHNLSDELSIEIAQAEAPLLVIGGIAQSEDKQAITKLIERWPGLVNIDVTSGLKYQFACQNHIIPSFDHPEVGSELAKNPPDLVVHLGARSTSKFYYRFLKANPPRQLWQVSDRHLNHDPSFGTTLNIAMSPQAFATSVLKANIETKKSPAFSYGTWMQRKAELIEHGPLSIPLFSKTMVESVRPDSVLVVGNSTAIRSFDYYVSSVSHNPSTFISQRGASGIEGHISSAIGVWHASRKSVCAVLGDVAFIHDLNALAPLARQQSASIKVFILNNQCGGIFHLLPMQDMEETLPLMTTEHHLTFEKVCSQFGLNYSLVETSDQLQQAITAETGTEIIEVKIDDSKNRELYQQLRTLK